MAARIVATLGRNATTAGPRARVASSVMATARPAAMRRGYASAAQSTTQQVKSDAPWAIASLLVFGSAFIYVTAPPKGGKKHDDHGHGGHGGGDAKAAAAPADDEEEEEAPAESEEGSSSDSSEYDFVDKIEGKPDDSAPSGNQHLASQSMDTDEHALRQRRTKDKPSGPSDNITFQKGIAGSKLGNAAGGEDETDEDKRHRVQSNPKKVVAEAHTERENIRAGKEEKSDDE